MHFILICTYAVWFLSEVVISRMLRATDGDRIHTDKSSLRLVWIVAVSSILVAVIIDHLYPTPVFSNPLYRLIGALITVSGMAVRIVAVKTLGRMFTVDVTIRQNHELKTEGIYRCLRHPAYAGLLLSFYGLALAINNWWSLFIIAIPITVVFIRRIKMEEQLLEEEFGEAYKAYRQRSKCLIPFVF